MKNKFWINLKKQKLNKLKKKKNLNIKSYVLSFYSFIQIKAQKNLI